MDRQTLLIADSSDAFCAALTEALQDRFTVLTCREGHSALTILRTQTVSLLVLNLMLPQLDGITLLERLKTEQRTPRILALTSIQTPYILETAAKLGVSYVMMKPCDIAATAARVCDLGSLPAPGAARQDVQTCLTQLLYSLSIRSSHLGCPPLREAIMLKMRCPDIASTKELYPEAAARCGCNATQVERNIRTALDSAWKKGNRQVWLRYFPNHSARPTNTEFIARLAEELRQRQRQGLVEDADP